MDIPNIVDEPTAVAFIKWCVDTIGLGFHPDTSFADYVDAVGNTVFNSAEVLKLDTLLDAAFAYCDPYEIGMTEFERLMNQPLMTEPDMP